LKPDLLSECNDQKIPPRDFKETFCNRCRNQNCVNAGWASSTFDERVRTQVDRLLVNPLQARPEDSRFDPIRAMHFVEVAAAISIARRADPWAGPGVHLAEPDPETVKSQVVEDAVSRLAEARGKKPRAPTAIAIETEGPPEPAPVAEPEPPPAPRPQPVANPPPLAMINTEFPDEGVMIGGGPPPAKPSQSSPKEEDSWAPKPKQTVVPRGTKIRMGE
jgi:hypothetical protein